MHAKAITGIDDNYKINPSCWYCSAHTFGKLYAAALLYDVTMIMLYKFSDVIAVEAVLRQFVDVWNWFLCVCILTK